MTFVDRLTRCIRVCLHAFVAIALAMIPGLSLAQAQAESDTRDYPRRPITIVVPFTPGNIDVLGRIYTNEISKTTKWSFLYDFKPGAAGTIGAAMVAKSPPDGYTLVGQSSTAAFAHLLPTKPFDWRKDLTPIYQLNRTTSLFMVSSAFPAQSVGEYIAYAKANPGKVNFAVNGFGGIVHIMSDLLNSQMGVKVTLVPFKGYAQIATSLAQGEAHATLASYPTFKPFIDAGKIRPLSLSIRNARMRQLPTLKSLAEEGLPDYEHVVWVGLFAPSATPGAIARRLNFEFNKAAKSDEVRERLETLGESVGGGSLEDFRQAMQATTERITKVVTDNKIELNL